MSLWQFRAAVNGYVAANAREEDNSLTNLEIEELGNWIDGR